MFVCVRLSLALALSLSLALALSLSLKIILLVYFGMMKKQKHIYFYVKRFKMHLNSTLNDLSFLLALVFQPTGSHLLFFKQFPFQRNVGVERKV